MNKIYKHVLIITPKQTGFFGGGVMNKRNITLMTAMSENQSVYEIDMNRDVTTKYKITKYFTRSYGYIAGLRKKYLIDIKQIINESSSIDTVCINSSLYGLVAKYIKQNFPQLKVIMFFHNAEYQYAIEEFKSQKKTLKLLIQIVNHFHAEYLALKYSDLRFVLSKRDDEHLKKIFRNKINHILPISIEDKGQIAYKVSENKPLELLFVGSAFFANIHGIRWFVKNVMPNVDAHLTIVGNDMDKFRDELQGPKVKVVGRVDSLKEVYQNADIVVSPIFYGSGMKTKTAEALMYGVPVLGTTEAFEGFEAIDCRLAGDVCHTATEFVDMIRYFTDNPQVLIVKAAQGRALYELHYSLEASLKKTNHFI